MLIHICLRYNQVITYNFLENLKQMFQNLKIVVYKYSPDVHLHIVNVDCDVLNISKYPITHWCATRRERVN